MSTPKLTQQQLCQVLPILSNSLRNIITTDHAEQRMRQRNITYDDIINTLQKPITLLDTRYDNKSYKYKISGVDKNKHIIIAIDGKTRTLHIVTVINKLYNH